MPCQFSMIFLGIFEDLLCKNYHRGSCHLVTRVEGAPYPLGAPPYLVSTSCALRTPFSCTIRILVGKNSLYNLPKVLTTVSRKYPLFLFRAVFVADLEHHDFTLLQQ